MIGRRPVQTMDCQGRLILYLSMQERALAARFLHTSVCIRGCQWQILCIRICEE